jgi:hypothetical protein
VPLHCITDVYNGAVSEIDFDWDALSQALVQPQFPVLQKVSVHVVIKSECSDVIWKDDLLERMSTLRSRGILSITETITDSVSERIVLDGRGLSIGHITPFYAVSIPPQSLVSTL